MLKRFLLALSVFLCLSATLFAQGTPLPQRAYGAGGTVPSSCSAPALFYKTSATQGLYHCVAGVYVTLGGSGGGAPIGGSGTTNKVAKFTASGTIGNSNITDTGTVITLGGNQVSTGLGVPINFYGGTSGFVQMVAPGTVSGGSYTFTLPTAQGAANTFLQNDGSGNLSSPANFTFNNSTRTAAVIGSANTLSLAGSATTLPVTLTATGTDTNVGVQVVPKGSGVSTSVAFSYGNDPLATGLLAQSTITTQGSGYSYYGDLNAAAAFIATLNPAADDADYNLNMGSLHAARSSAANTKTITEIDGLFAIGEHRGSGIANAVYGATNIASGVGPTYNVYGTVGIGKQIGSSATGNVSGGSFSALLENSASASAVYGIAASAYIGTGSTATNAYGIYIPSVGGIGAATNYGLWLGDQTVSGGTSDYAIWHDSPGVWRLKSDGVVAYYNPSFTKYTVDAVNHERIVTQWNSNVAEIGTEAGGTGTLRQLNFLGSGFGWKGTTSGVLTHTVPATVTSYSLLWPAAQASGTKVLQNDGSGNLSWAAAGGGTAPIIEPASKVAVTSGLVFPNVFVGAGSGWKHFEGLGIADATTLNADATWALLYHMPPALPTGTAKLRLRCISALSSGALKFNPKWNMCGTAEDCSSVTLNAETTQTLTYTVAGAFVEVDTTLDASTVAAGKDLIMNLVFEDTNTTAAGTSTCSAFIVFIP